ncbi:M24 family metallopeptidase [Conexibacter woesei]|uniref:Peptidase M24 n=1 Tax=Conexibacter woesei (strain DSM 14684 / CCUG 47730 / CIP 108061 / JCM 11494 / NBRC 100937 / ID131577) TaxID=469383 RepID=D3F9D1_CONWI|nr:Xaa-Pro peptidase family protein [Conexibacter woesei]ADB49098.1 peptidase M24 [Conexibacter woesei DSM 14684]
MSAATTTPDFASRASRLAGLLGELEGFVASDPANVRWLSGAAGEPHVLYGHTPLWAVVGPGGACRLVAAAADMAWLADLVDTDEVIPYGRFVFAGDVPPRLARLATPTPLEQALAEALEAVGAGARVGVDDGMPLTVQADLAPKLAPRELVPAAPLPIRARSVKDEYELERMRRANRIAEGAIVRSLSRAGVGASEHDILRWLRTEMVEQGARPMLGSVAFNERGALVDTVPTDRTAERGDVVRFDVGCTVEGYHSDLSRIGTIGEPDAWVRETYAALLAGEQAAIAKAAPGVRPSELYDIAVAVTRDAGLPEYDRSHCGHGIGLQIYEPPLVAPGHDEPLRAGQTLCLETPYYVLGRAGLQVEDAVVVTADGCERLGTASQDLIIV